MEVLLDWRFLPTRQEAVTLTTAIAGAASAPVGVYLIGLGRDRGPAQIGLAITSRWQVREAVKQAVLAHQPNPLAQFRPLDLDLAGLARDGLAFYRLVPRAEARYITPDHMLTAIRAMSQIRGRLVGGLGMVIWGWKHGRAKVDVATFALGVGSDDRGRPVDAQSLAWGVGVGPSRGNALGIARPLLPGRALRRFLQGRVPTSMLLLRRSVEADELQALWHLPVVSPGLGAQGPAGQQYRPPFVDPLQPRSFL